MSITSGLADWASLLPLDVGALALCSFVALGVALRLVPRSPTRGRITLYSCAAVAAIVLLGGWFVNDAGRVARNNLRETVAGYAPTYAMELSRLGHADLPDGCAADDPRYLEMIEAQKRWLAANRSIADIYTFRRLDDGGYALLVDSETDYDNDGAYTGTRESRTSIGERYEDDTPELAKAFAGVAGFSDRPHTDRWGTWVSAVHPMYDTDGRVEAVLGVDFHAERWHAQVAAAQWTVIAYVSMLVLLTVLGVGAYEVLACSLERARVAEGLASGAARSKGQMLANMSHEVRTPMTAIIGYSDLLLDSGSTEQQRRSSVETIRRNAVHLLGMLNDLLDASKIEAGMLRIEEMPTDIVRVCEDAVAMLRLSAQGKGIELLRTYHPPLPESVRTDPLRLRQILLNLLSNAIKFTEKGRVTLEVRLIGGENSAAHALQIDVTDTGIGIMPEQLSRLFLPFEQADSSTTRRFGGTGLGLSISKHLAERLGGDITIRSTVGVGSTFSVTIATGDLTGVAMRQSFEFDTDDQQPVAADQQPQRSERPLSGVRVLVAEDGADNQRLISHILSRAGASVTVVGNGRLAVEALCDAAANTGDFDAVLMDMQMPELDGYGAAAQLRRAGVACPVLALTANTDVADIRRSIEAGCDDHLTKPIDRALLIAKLRSWVDEYDCRAPAEGVSAFHFRPAPASPLAA